MFGTVMPFYISLVGLKGRMIIIRKPLCSTISWSQRPRLRDVRRNCTRFLSVSAHWLEMQKKQIVKASGLGANVMQQKRDLASRAKWGSECKNKICSFWVKCWKWISPSENFRKETNEIYSGTAMFQNWGVNRSKIFEICNDRRLDN